MSLQDDACGRPSVDLLLRRGWLPIETGGFVGLIGPLLYKDDDGPMRFGFVAEARHLDPCGVVQFGMIAAFADRSLAMACQRANDDRPQATIGLSVRSVDGVQVGEFVEAACEVVRKTRTVVFMRGTLTAGGRTVATADGIWKLLASWRE